MAKSSFGSVETLPSGRFRARYMVTPRAWRSAPTTFTTKGEAQAWLRREAVRNELQAAGSPKAVAAARADLPRFEDYAEMWIKERRTKKGPLRRTTRRTYEGYLAGHVKGTTLGRSRLDAISQDRVREWYRGLDNDHPTGKARIYAWVKCVLATAVDEELIDRQPARIKGAANVTPKTKVVVLEPDELASLAAEMRPESRPIVYLGAFAQLRIGEALALRRRDVLVKEGVLRITRGATNVSGIVTVDEPKTPAGVRDVALPRSVVALLKAHLESVPNRGDALLFEDPTRPGQPVKTQTMADRVHRAAGRAGLPPEFRFHHLRHSGLTWLAEAGASVAELQARAGHTTPNMALRYQHARAERDKALAATLDPLARAPKPSPSRRPARPRSSAAEAERGPFPGSVRAL